MACSSLSDPPREREATEFAAAIHLLEDRLVVRVSGDDRISFMHGMCTADVKRLAPGELVRALFLTERAHLIADCFIFALQEQVLWLEVDRQCWPAVREHLERFLVADDVELEELGALRVIDVEGRGSTEVVAEFAGDAVRRLAPWQHLEKDGLLIAHLPRLGASAFTSIGPQTLLAAAAAQMKQSASGTGELTAETANAIRIKNGLALIGTDTDERTLALEARLEPAIAFNKGCYVGQETIERATAHGSLKRRLFGIRIIGEKMPSTGASIQLGGKEVGRLTSVAFSPATGIIGLAILHHSAWTANTRVMLSGKEGTIDGLVCDLPFSQMPASSNKP